MFDMYMPISFLSFQEEFHSLFVFSHSLCNLYPGNTYLTFLNCFKDSEVFSLLRICIKKALCELQKSYKSVHGAVNHRSS